MAMEKIKENRNDYTEMNGADIETHEVLLNLFTSVIPCNAWCRFRIPWQMCLYMNDAAARF